MKLTIVFALVAVLSFFGCKEPQPISVTMDDLSLTVPAGYTEDIKGLQMTCGESVNPVQNRYSKIESKSIRDFQVLSADQAYAEAEDHDYTTSRVLSVYRIFYSELSGDKFTYVEEVPITIGDKKGILITFEDKSGAQPIKGEMIAVYHNKKVYMLLYSDYTSHFEEGKAEWVAIKSSVKFK